MANTKRGQVVPVPANMGQVKFISPASGLNKQGVPSAMALKSKKITNLPLAKG